MEILVTVFAAVLLLQVLRSRSVLAREEDVPAIPFLGRNEMWSDRGRAVQVWGVAWLLVHARAFSHSTMWLD